MDLAVEADAEGAELPGPVAEGLPQLGRHVEDEGAGVAGLGDDPRDPERVVAVLAQHGRVVRHAPTPS